MIEELDYVEHCRSEFLNIMKRLMASIGDVPIAAPGQLPYGWRKAAKGRTVWRLLEEVISQNLEAHATDLGMLNFTPAESEVGVYDFRFNLPASKTIYVNVKSAVSGGRTNKDDISKAVKLFEFLDSIPYCVLLIATVEIEFLDKPLRIRLSNCYVVPVSWLPDVYVNPSNNGNLQSSKYKSIGDATPRLCAEFLRVLSMEMDVAAEKRAARRR